jgi:hypothetical protein
MPGRPSVLRGNAAGFFCELQEFVLQERVLITCEGIPVIPGDAGDTVVHGNLHVLTLVFKAAAPSADG